MRLLVVLMALITAGCASDTRPDSRKVGYGCALCGYVEDVRMVRVDDDSIGLGAVIGAAAGAAVGRQVGDGSGRDAATVAGAVVGGVLGHEIEKRQRADEMGYQFVVELDDGRIATVTQLDSYGIDEGDRVELRGEEIVPYRGR